MSTEYLSEQFAKVRAEVASLKRDRVTYRTAEVTAVDPASSTFAADSPGAGELSGIAAPPQFMPAVGDQVRLTVSGATPIYEVGRIGQDAVSYVELAPEVTEDMLLFQTQATEALTAANGKNTVTYSVDNPSGSGTRAGDPWFKRDATGVILGSWEWDGDSWEPRTYGDGVLNSLTVGKLVAGTMNAVIVNAGRFTTALTGARREMNAIGFQAYNSANTLTVNIDGVTNLLTGTFKTALTGRRIEIGASGIFGRIAFLGPAGETGVIESYTDPTTSVEAIRQVQPISGAWPAWNGLQFQTNERAYLSSGNIQVHFGGSGTGSKAFTLFYATDDGTATTLPNRETRLFVDSQMIRMYVAPVEDEGSIDILRNNPTDDALRSPKLLFRAKGGEAGNHLKYVVNSNLTTPRLEVTNTNDDGYGSIWAASFTVSSSAAGKEQIGDLSVDTAFDQLRAMRVRTWRQRLDGGSLGPVRIGLVAEEAPAEVVEGEAQAVNLYSLTGLTVAGLQRVIVRLLDMGQELAALKAKVALLEGRAAPR